jgi:hypothetical protein
VVEAVVEAIPAGVVVAESSSVSIGSTTTGASGVGMGSGFRYFTPTRARAPSRIIARRMAKKRPHECLLGSAGDVAGAGGTGGGGGAAITGGFTGGAG